MRDLSNLERLSKLKKEAIDINNRIKIENVELIAERDLLIEEVIADFIEELKELSKYGNAGYTGIKLDFEKSSHGTYAEIIHESQNGKFRLLANPDGYSKRVILYDCDLGWDWYEYKTKKFIAINKDKILDAIETKVAQQMAKYIEDTSIVDSNIKLKKEIEKLKK